MVGKSFCPEVVGVSVEVKVGPGLGGHLGRLLDA